MNTVTVNISFQDALLRDIDRMAKGEARSRSELLREAARAYIQRKERWADLFALGQQTARRRALRPEDVASELAAHRRQKTGRP